MVRWLERNGYDVSYFTGVDTDRRGSEILEHKIFLSVGHDEYWSGDQRANVEAARDAGVNLAFFSGNESYWKTRWETEHRRRRDTAYRTLVSYKETHANAKIDPAAGDPTWTGTWRDPALQPAGRRRTTRERADRARSSWSTPAPPRSRCPAADGKMRFWRNTSVASLAAGPDGDARHGTLGYEWDEDLDNGARPAGLVAPVLDDARAASSVLQDYGSTYGSGTATHHLTLYRAPSGALVFGAGTSSGPGGSTATTTAAARPPDARMQQATVNLLADMGVQPGTLQAG